MDSGLACEIHGEYVSHQPGHFKQCLTMCLTALKNRLVLGNCQPIISTPSSGLSPALHRSLALCLCVLVSRHLSLSISFSLLNSPSQPPFSVTHTLSQISILFFLPARAHVAKCYIFCYSPSTKALLVPFPFFSTAFPARFISSSTLPSCKTAADAPY